MSDKPRGRGRATKVAKEADSGRKKRAPTKRAASDSGSSSDEGEQKGKKQKNGAAGASGRKNATDTKFVGENYDEFQKTNDGKSFNLKLASWNAGGLRALIKKGGFEYLTHEKPDIFCLQETKCSEKKLPDEAKLKDYHAYWACGNGAKDGYAGVAVYSKKKPLSVKYGLGISKHDDEGRCITAEYDDFFLVNAYVPNSGRGLVTLPKRMTWNKDFHHYLAELDKKKPVILTGDLNVSHQEIDIARPKTNTRSAGFTQEERDGFSDLLAMGFVDTFRHLYPDKKDTYTYWTYMMNCRAKNVGWRLDYFVISERLQDKLCDSVMRSHVMGSDHCPIVLAMHM